MVRLYIPTCGMRDPDSRLNCWVLVLEGLISKSCSMFCIFDAICMMFFYRPYWQRCDVLLIAPPLSLSLYIYIYIYIYISRTQKTFKMLTLFQNIYKISISPVPVFTNTGQQMSGLITQMVRASGMNPMVHVPCTDNVRFWQWRPLEEFTRC